MKKLISATLAASLALSLAACGSSASTDSVAASSEAASTESTAASSEAAESTAETSELAGTTLKVAASPTPHAEILNAAKDILAEQGIDLEVVEYTDYVQPNTALEEGSLDANYFQHITYMNNYNEANGTKPSVYPLYSVGAGASTLPQYSDARLQDSVPQQIIAAGAVQAQSADNADLILALNTPQDGIVKDSTADDNQPFAYDGNKNFLGILGQLLSSGRNVSLADISYSNGADNGFMSLLANSTNLQPLAAYNGWNTADNAVGYAIAQGLIARDMSSEARSRLLRQRLIDDWFYQSNARRSISNELEKHNREDLKYDLATEEKNILQQITTDCQSMANSYSITRGTRFTLSFPWKRLFEVDVEIKK